VLTPEETQAFTARGLDPLLVRWWPTVAAHTAADPRALGAGVRLPADGNVVHLQPIEVMRWINDITWKSEWPKYQIAVAAPPAPPNRRV
jgi:hypothetical protein